MEGGGVRRGCVVGEPSAREGERGRKRRSVVGGKATRIYGTGETIGITPLSPPLLPPFRARPRFVPFPLPAKGPQARNDRSSGLAPPTRENDTLLELFQREKEGGGGDGGGGKDQNRKRDRNA